MKNLTPTILARVFFVLIAVAFAVMAANSFNVPTWQGALGGLIFGGIVTLLDAALKNLTFRGFSNATMGLLVGLLCGFLIDRVVKGLFEGQLLREGSSYEEVVRLAIYLTFGFWGMSLAMRSNRQEFSLIIPYVRFRQESAYDSPLLLDSNVIIDGRVPRICETGFLSGPLVVPRFVLDELQILADSPDHLKRERGTRGLRCLDEIQNSPHLEVTIQEDYDTREAHTDTKLVHLAQRMGARLVTNDANLGKVAQLQGITVLNLNLLTLATRPNLIPGDPMEIKLVKEGKDPHQAVGYLDDGTMIVVNNAARHVGETVEVVLGSPLQTSAGRLVFAELKSNGNTVAKSKRA